MPGKDTQHPAEIVLYREMQSLCVENVTLLDATLRTEVTGNQLRLFFKGGTPVEAIDIVTSGAEQVFLNFGGAPVIDIDLAPGVKTLRLRIKGREVEISPHVVETGLFDNLNTIMATRNGESVETVLDWLKYHTAHHGMQAALIFDRAKPDQDADFVKDLRDRARDVEGLQRLVILRASVPFGKEDLPAEAHPINVPGAPGKDRMEIPPVDPWRAPLGEVLLYEIMRARFLSGARAVANLEVNDLLADSDGCSAFDLAVAAETGCINLIGRQVYPWRLRNDVPARFGDHIYNQFDTTSVRRRWCLAPGKTGQNTIWRLIRVVGARPDIDKSVHFHRFMTLRHPVGSVSQIVPKTSLVENPDLLTLALEYFDHKPVRMPAEEVVSHHDRSETTAIITTMKNEGPFILEWLAYHRAIGVDDFLIYTNDCDDGTDTMLQLLQEKGFVQHRDNPFRGSELKPQHAALQAAEQEPVIAKAGWVICMDVDEYINIKCGDGTLAALFEAVGDANMISMTWRLFGNNDINVFSDDLITQKYTRAARELIRKPHQAWGFKTLFHNIGIFKKLGVHRPKGLKPQLWQHIRWVNGSGLAMPASMYRTGWRSNIKTYGYDLVQLNHYAVRSAESFLVKRDRGRVNHVNRDQGLSYWFRMNNNAEKELSIQRKIPRLQAELDKLLSDQDIAQAHARSVRLHREKITELKGRDDFLDLYNQIAGRKLQKLSRMHAHFGANVFLSGPDEIPDEIADNDPNSEFWFNVKRQQTKH